VDKAVQLAQDNPEVVEPASDTVLDKAADSALLGYRRQVRRPRHIREERR